MNQTPHAWWDFGYAGIFGCVFLEQIGVPIPAFPALLAAGALVASGEFSLPLCLAVAVLAALLADIIWYGIGWVKGGKVLNLMCRLSWRSDTCVSKTKGAFSQYGAKTLLFAKFIPGLSVIAPPLAGITQVPFRRFVLYDGLGSLLWAIAPLAAGAYLQKSFTAFSSEAYSMVPYLPWVCGFLIVIVLAWRYFNRSHYLETLQASLRGGISPVELKTLLDQDRDIVVLDIRDQISAKTNPVILPKARWIPYGILADQIEELPLKKPLIVYCDCPEDQGAVAMVGLLRQHGANEARLLRGGLDAWINHGFETLDLEAK